MEALPVTEKNYFQPYLTNSDNVLTTAIKDIQQLHEKMSAIKQKTNCEEWTIKDFKLDENGTELFLVVQKISSYGSEPVSVSDRFGPGTWLTKEALPKGLRSAIPVYKNLLQKEASFSSTIQERIKRNKHDDRLLQLAQLRTLPEHLFYAYVPEENVQSEMRRLQSIGPDSLANETRICGTFCGHHSAARLIPHFSNDPAAPSSWVFVVTGIATVRALMILCETDSTRWQFERLRVKVSLYTDLSMIEIHHMLYQKREESFVDPVDLPDGIDLLLYFRRLMPMVWQSLLSSPSGSWKPPKPWTSIEPSEPIPFQSSVNELKFRRTQFFKLLYPKWKGNFPGINYLARLAAYPAADEALYAEWFQLLRSDRIADFKSGVMVYDGREVFIKLNLVKARELVLSVGKAVGNSEIDFFAELKRRIQTCLAAAKPTWKIMVPVTTEDAAEFSGKEQMSILRSIVRAQQNAVEEFGAGGLHLSQPSGQGLFFVPVCNRRLGCRTLAVYRDAPGKQSQPQLEAYLDENDQWINRSHINFGVDAELLSPIKGAAQIYFHACLIFSEDEHIHCDALAPWASRNKRPTNAHYRWMDNWFVALAPMHKETMTLKKMFFIGPTPECFDIGSGSDQTGGTSELDGASRGWVEDDEMDGSSLLDAGGGSSQTVGTPEAPELTATQEDDRLFSDF